MLTSNLRKTPLLLIFLLLFSCTNDKVKENKTINEDKTAKEDKTTIVKTDPKQELVGEWKEHWGIGMETTVRYSDLYKIQLTKNGDIVVTCKNKKNFVIDQLLFDGKELSFRKQNKAYSLGKFYVYYRLKLHDDFNWMEGPITNNKKQKDYVKWEKMDVTK